MDINQINVIASRGESPTLEFKTSTNQLSRACETICAFLNAKGGSVFIGVKNNGQIIGMVQKWLVLGNRSRDETYQ